MFKQQKLRNYSAGIHSTSLLRFKYSVLTPGGETAAHPGTQISLSGTVECLNELLKLSPGLSYDRLRRELVRDGVSVSVVTVTDYAGRKGDSKLVVLITPCK
jgi:hypothetical protein